MEKTKAVIEQHLDDLDELGLLDDLDEFEIRQLKRSLQGIAKSVIEDIQDMLDYTKRVKL